MEKMAIVGAQWGDEGKGRLSTTFLIIMSGSYDFLGEQTQDIQSTIRIKNMSIICYPQ